jgi:DNA-binding CsgD family transcriptional regulator
VLELDELLYGEDGGFSALENWEFLKWGMKKAKLTCRENTILQMRYWEGYSLTETATILNVTVNRVRQLQGKALMKLAAIFRGGSWRDYDIDKKGAYSRDEWWEKNKEKFFTILGGVIG